MTEQQAIRCATRNAEFFGEPQVVGKLGLYLNGVRYGEKWEHASEADQGRYMYLETVIHVIQPPPGGIKRDFAGNIVN